MASLYASHNTANSLPNCYVVGRGRACDIRLDDARISSQHCRIFCIEGQEAGRITLKAYIEDTSSNGTYINRSVRLQKVRYRSKGQEGGTRMS